MSILDLNSNKHLSSICALIVDDDRLIHEFVALGLDNLGIYDVLKAENGDEALRYVEEHLNTIDVIFCDLNMPHMDGLEFLRHLSNRNYAGAIILMSGEDVRILKTAANLAKAHKLKVLGSLEKPLKLDSFKDILSELKTTVDTKKVNMVQAVSENDLREALKYDQFNMVYQPKIDMQSNHVVGVEALARWQHPSKGFISPVMFIAAAEDCGLINEITDVLFMKAFEQMGRCHTKGHDLMLSINLSVDSLGRLELPEYLTSCAARFGVDLGKVMIEITESRLMHDVATSLEILSRLCLKGLSLSIDDFGTGYSTMEQLRLIPFSELKIDRSFVTNADTDTSQRAILESSIELAKKLNMQTVSEGIETQADWDLVKSLGCHIAQGYFIAKPMPAEHLSDWLVAWNRQHGLA